MCWCWVAAWGGGPCWLFCRVFFWRAVGCVLVLLLAEFFKGGSWVVGRDCVVVVDESMMSCEALQLRNLT